MYYTLMEEAFKYQITGKTNAIMCIHRIHRNFKTHMSYDSKAIILNMRSKNSVYGVRQYKELGMTKSSPGNHIQYGFSNINDMP